MINVDRFHKCHEDLKAKIKDIESQGKGNKPHVAEATSDQEVDRLYDVKQHWADKL